MVMVILGSRQARTYGVRNGVARVIVGEFASLRV